MKTGAVTGPLSLPYPDSSSHPFFTNSGILVPMTARTFAYQQLDVFTNQPLQGNMLAVFTDARGLSDAEMQAIAKETNLSETTFILPRDAETEAREGVKVRIFTVEEELQFAGHPTLGTAYLLHQSDDSDQVTLDLKVGKIPVTFTRDAQGLAFGEMRQRDPEFGQVHDDAVAIARIAGIRLDDIDASLPIQTVSTGMPFVIVPIRTLAALRNLRFNWQAASDYLAKTDGKFFYFVSEETEQKTSSLHARMIFYNGEDPATGSAAGCCAAWAVQHGVVASDAQAIIEQGIEMKRASYIHFRATKRNESVSNVRVGGHCVKVSDATLSF
ncbi:PhzF family phenazine biosynthesis protein [Candidatus Korobacter versatilis]|nr:PhzF family phenazine biosynthesis protein [Candidatus Koribacter versatilis]